MESFLMFILIVIGSFYLLGWLGRILLRRWIIRKQKEAAEMFGGGGNYSRSYTWGTRGKRSEQRKEGEVKVHKPSQPEKKVAKSIGDYVEYEEVEIVEETDETDRTSDRV